jgi:VanZ family protein
MRPFTHAQVAKPSGISRILALAYALLIVYGSLYPFSGWTAIPGEEAWTFLTAPWPRYISRSDIITNVLVYLPLGLLSARALRAWLRPPGAVFAATAAGLLLSLAMESLQTFLPGRVSSRLDLVLNVAGSLGGAMLAALMQSPRSPLRRIGILRREWFVPGRLADLGLVVVGLWTLAQLTPLLIALDAGVRRAGLPPWTPGYPLPFNFSQLGIYALGIGGLGVFLSLLTRAGRRITPAFAVFVAAVLLTKISVIGRYLSLEMAWGALLGTVFAGMFGRGRRYLRLALAALAVLGGFTLMELEPDPDALPMMVEDFNWVPFRGQMHSLAGYAEILSLFWPFVALGCLGVMAARGGRRRGWILAGSVLILLMMFGLEWQQQSIPGRRADITDVLLALGGWLLPWWRRFYDGRKELDGQPAGTHP